MVVAVGVLEGTAMVLVEPEVGLAVVGELVQEVSKTRQRKNKVVYMTLVQRLNI
jgi:hypothetical protein